MSSIAALVAMRGPIRQGDEDGDDVRVLQLALSQAGYKVGIDGQFGAQTEHSVETFQRQQGIGSDGIVGPRTAALLDSPHDHLVAVATPIVVNGSPHDDSASLIAFYGRPWQDDLGLLVPITPPFPMWYGAQQIHTLRFHVKAHAALLRALNTIWDAAGHDANSDLLRHVKHFAGSYNYRPIRGSSRLSCHSFGAAIDFDAAELPMGKRVLPAEMPHEIVDIFKAEGFTWGGDFRGRPDSMHVQMAHE